MFLRLFVITLLTMSAAFAQTVSVRVLPSGEAEVSGAGFNGSESSYFVEVYLNHSSYDRTETNGGRFSVRIMEEAFQYGDTVRVRVIGYMSDSEDFVRDLEINPTAPTPPPAPPTPPVAPPVPPRPPVVVVPPVPPVVPPTPPPVPPRPPVVVVPPSPPAVPPTPPPVPPAPPVQNCNVGIATSQRDTRTATVSVSCSLPGVHSFLVVRSGRELLFQSTFPSETAPRLLGTFPRDPSRRLDVQWELHSGDRHFNGNDVIYKDASFAHAPAGTLESPAALTPVGAGSGDERRWEVTLQARVSDGDVDASERRALIRVQLVDLASGRVLQTESANTGDRVSFRLTASYTKKWTGDDYVWRGDLHEGENRLVVRVLDAYNGTAPAAELGPVVISIRR